MRAIESIDPDVILIDLGNLARYAGGIFCCQSRGFTLISMFVEQSDDTIGAH
jgi:hypothetical protein